MTKPKILLSRAWPKAAEDRAKRDFDATLNATDVPLSADDWKAAAAEYDAICPTVSDQLPPDFLTGASRVKILGNFGVGHNHIDLGAAASAGVVVTNTPGVLTDCTADIAMGLLIAAARRIGEGERLVRADAWEGWGPTQLIGRKVSGATLGIIGFGRIGRAMARRAYHGFGMKIVVYNRSPVADLAEYGAVQLDRVEDVCAAADFVSLHCPGGAETRHIMSASAIAAMKSTGILVNTARGDVVDEGALSDALAAGRIGGAGLDVYEAEPHVPAALRSLDNVVVAPHLGSATMETRVAMGMMALDNLAAFFAGQEPPNRIA